MKKKVLLPLGTFTLVFLIHAAYLGWRTSRISQQWTGVEDQSLLSSYFEQQDFWMGLSYALAGAFTVYALLKFSENRKSCVAGIIGGVTLIGILNVAGCFLLGCCGSPMLAVYLSLFGSTFLGFTKPLVAAITLVTVIIGTIWIERTSIVKTQ